MAEAAFALPSDLIGPSEPADNSPLILRERVALVRPPCFWPALPGKPPLSPAERAGLIRLAETIPGAWGDEAMVALMEAMRHAPAGDVVEVGSGCGRISTLLVWLARRYQVGSVLCIDDWSGAALADFEITLAPLADSRLNCVQGAEASDYGPDLVVASKTFGDTRYEGRIAVLRLAPGADAATWTDFLAPGGWIVFDGAPNTASEAFIDARREHIGAKFTAGEALFVQLKR